MEQLNCVHNQSALRMSRHDLHDALVARNLSYTTRLTKIVLFYGLGVDKSHPMGDCRTILFDPLLNALRQADKQLLTLRRLKRDLASRPIKSHDLVI